MGTSVSAIITVTTPSLGVAPGPAQAVTVSNISTTTLTLSWTAPLTGTTPFSYQPEQALAGSSPSWVDIGNSATTATSVPVTGLTPYTGYQFEVLTTNGTGSSLSATATATTLAVAAGAPTGLALVGSPTTTSVGLQWSAPAVGTLPYTYQVYDRTPSGSGTFAIAAPTTATTSQTISGLTAGSSYDFEVNATNPAGTGPYSAILSGVQTASLSILPAAPTNLAAGTPTTTTIPVSWTAPATGTTPMSYVVQYRPH